MAVRGCCPDSRPQRDVRDLLSEKGIPVDASKVSSWDFKSDRKPQRMRGLRQHAPLADRFMIACRTVDQTYFRVGGKWGYPSRAVDQFGRLVGFRPPARQDMNAIDERETPWTCN